MYLKFYEVAKKQAKNNVILPFIHADFPKEYFIEERENIIYIYRIREWGEYIFIDTSYFSGEIYRKEKLYGLFNLSKYSFEIWDLHGNKNTLKLPLYVKRAIQRLI